MLNGLHKRLIARAAAVGILLFALSSAPALALRSLSSPIPQMERQIETQPQISPAQMQQHHQRMMEKMGHIHILMGSVLTSLSQMSPQEMREYRPLVMAYYDSVLEQTQQLIDQLSDNRS